MASSELTCLGAYEYYFLEQLVFDKVNT